MGDGIMGDTRRKRKDPVNGLLVYTIKKLCMDKIKNIMWALS